MATTVVGCVLPLIELAFPCPALPIVTRLALAPPTINFGKEPFGLTGATSKTRTVTVSNPSKQGQTIAIESIRLTGMNQGDFDSRTDCPQSLMPGEQ
jgi:hypothetical protein